MATIYKCTTSATGSGVSNVSDNDPTNNQYKAQIPQINTYSDFVAVDSVGLSYPHGPIYDK